MVNKELKSIMKEEFGLDMSLGEANSLGFALVSYFQLLTKLEGGDLS